MAEGTDNIFSGIFLSTLTFPPNKTIPELFSSSGPIPKSPIQSSPGQVQDHQMLHAAICTHFPSIHI